MLYGTILRAGEMLLRVLITRFISFLQAENAAFNHCYNTSLPLSHIFIETERVAAPVPSMEAVLYYRNAFSD